MTRPVPLPPAWRRPGPRDVGEHILYQAALRLPVGEAMALVCGTKADARRAYYRALGWPGVRAVKRGLTVYVTPRGERDALK